MAHAIVHKVDSQYLLLTTTTVSPCGYDGRRPAGGRRSLRSHPRPFWGCHCAAAASRRRWSLPGRRVLIQCWCSALHYFGRWEFAEWALDGRFGDATRANGECPCTSEHPASFVSRMTNAAAPSRKMAIETVAANWASIALHWFAVQRHAPVHY